MLIRLLTHPAVLHMDSIYLKASYRFGRVLLLEADVRVPIQDPVFLLWYDFLSVPDQRIVFQTPLRISNIFYPMVIKLKLLAHFLIMRRVLHWKKDFSNAIAAILSIYLLWIISPVRARNQIRYTDSYCKRSWQDFSGYIFFIYVSRIVSPPSFSHCFELLILFYY